MQKPTLSKRICIALFKPPIAENTYGKVIRNFASIAPPTGLCCIAAVAEREGHKVIIVDAEVEGLGVDALVRRIVELRPDIVGVTCMTAGVYLAHCVARKLKDVLSGVLVVAGGPHPSAIPDRTLYDFPCFDVLVIGEGGRTFAELIAAIIHGESLHGVNGIAFRENGQHIITPPRQRVMDLDTLPLPAYHLLRSLEPYRPYWNEVPGPSPCFPVTLSRGCPQGQCEFCDRTVFGNIYTKYSPKRAVELITYLVRERGVRSILFDDDSLTAHKRWLLSFLKLLRETLKAPLPFSCESRVDTVDEEILAALKEAGCGKIMYGMESGSDAMLYAMGKGTTTKDIMRAVELTNKHRIGILGYFIVGYPDETEDTMRATVRFIKEIAKTKPFLFDIAVQPFEPLPGVPIRRFALANGSYDEDCRDAGTFSKIRYVSNGLTAKLIGQYLNMCYDACYKNWRAYLTAYRRVHSWRDFITLLKLLTAGSIWPV